MCWFVVRAGVVWCRLPSVESFDFLLGGGGVRSLLMVKRGSHGEVVASGGSDGAAAGGGVSLVGAGGLPVELVAFLLRFLPAVDLLSFWASSGRVGEALAGEPEERLWRALLDGLHGSRQRCPRRADAGESSRDAFARSARDLTRARLRSDEVSLPEARRPFLSALLARSRA